MAELYYSQPNQQAVRDGDPVAAGTNDPDPIRRSETSETFDPSEHTVDEVKSYVETHPDAAQAVYDAEAEGKQRTTLLDWLTSED